MLGARAQDLGNGTSQLVACGLKGQTVTQRPGFKQLTTRLPVDVAARRVGLRVWFDLFNHIHSSLGVRHWQPLVPGSASED